MECATSGLSYCTWSFLTSVFSFTALDRSVLTFFVNFLNKLLNDKVLFAFLLFLIEFIPLVFFIRIFQHSGVTSFPHILLFIILFNLNCYAFEPNVVVAKIIFFLSHCQPLFSYISLKKRYNLEVSLWTSWENPMFLIVSFYFPPALWIFLIFSSKTIGEVILLTFNWIQVSFFLLILKIIFADFLLLFFYFYIFFVVTFAFPSLS